MTPDRPAPTPAPLDAFGPRSWTRPEATGFGREPMATALDRGDGWSVSLDGAWPFVLRDRPEAVTAADLVGDAAEWATVEVPGCWTVQGYDRPQYTNIQMPFPGPPPQVPDANPTGIYRRTVSVPAAWTDRRILLHVGGAESVLYAFVDGAPVGMGKDSRLPTELDLTDRVAPGESFELALVVVRWSDATYLEDQDHWYHAGLHRSVVLRSEPWVRIADVHVVADRDPTTGRGELAARIAADWPGDAPAGWSVRIRLDGPDGATLAEASGAVHGEHPTDELVNWLVFEGRQVALAASIPDVAAWSAETPALHPLAVELVDGAGTVADHVTLSVGFRRVEVVGHELLVNGRPVLIRGVNRHDHDPRRGKAVTAAGIEADLVLMKQHNIDAVRTSHYPNDPVLYDLCDRLGLYVVDEADLETHAYLRSLTKDPRWASAIGERVRRMALRDKNHPSIICWSLGNESGISPALDAAATWLRRWDPTRPIQYEGSIGEHLFGDLAAGVVPEMAEVLARPKPESDLIAPMYPAVEDLVAWATAAPGPDRPLVMCEYIHAMNNSCGGLDAYWDAIRTHPGLQGGFVWDWVDQALVQRLPNGTERLAYGGDFGDEPNDGPFCLNGLVAADRTPHPSLLELAAVVAPVRIAAIDAPRGRFSVTNEHAFVDLSWLEPTWSLGVDGVEVASGLLPPMAVPAGASDELRVPIDGLVPALGPGSGSVAHLTVGFRTRADLPWAGAGHVVARHQAEVARADGLAPAPSEPAAGAGGGGGAAPLALDAFEPVLALWRAPIDNETFGPTIGWKHADRWAAIGLPHAADRVPLGTELAADSDGDGALRVAHEVTVPDDLDDIARVGVRLRLGPGIRGVEWLGDGPHEGYTDRRASTRVGRWTTSVDAWSVPYVHPQASGNRTGVRWLRFLDADGAVVRAIDLLAGVGAGDGLQVTVSRWTDEEVAAAAHLDDLPGPGERDECYVWLDVAHRGVGSAAVGPDVAPAHRVGPGTYRWSYRLR